MKKVIIFKGGLGNQIFQYGMYTWQKSVRHRDVCYMYREADHNGFELDRWFNVSLQKASVFYKWLYWVIWRLNKYGLLKRGIWFGRDKDERSGDLFVNGYWTKRAYFMHEGFDITFKQLPLMGKNRCIADLMEQTDSIAVHVRRGDYLLPQNTRIFCQLDEDYYRKGIERCCRTMQNPHFFFFSDDMAWVKEHIRVEHAEYIDWNKGDDSIYDMYLMSQAKSLIIANSTFSFWAAMLGRQHDTVIYPAHWYVNGTVLDIFPDDWVAL